MERLKRAAAPEQPRRRLFSEDPPTGFTPSGSTLLDLVLGRGWPHGRIVNVVGERSAGKTLLAVEACANFIRVTDPDFIRYVEAEDAWDAEYARIVGMPKGVKPKQGIRTVEALFDDLTRFLDKQCNGKDPAFYCVDSLDALSDEAELARDFEKSSYGTAKAAKMSELFRRKVGDIAEANCTLFVISQVRDKIGVMFGETKTRSGGKALDFYASIILWLREIKRLERTVMGNKRAVGTLVHARTKKNKVAKSYRNCELSILYNYGIDDEVSMLDWLEDNNGTDCLERSVKELRESIRRAREKRDREFLAELSGELKMAVHQHWERIEAALAPPLSKYGN